MCVCVCVCLLLETPIIKDNVDPNNKNGLRRYPLLLGSFWFEAPFDFDHQLRVSVCVCLLTTGDPNNKRQRRP